MARLRRWAMAGGAVLLGAYLAMTVTACSMQRSLMYFPDPAERAPPASPAIQVVRLTAPDGQHLVGWWLAPKPGRPTILFFGGNGDALAGETPRFEACAGKGVGMLAVAYEGYSGSGGHPTEAALHGDADAAYAWLAARTPASDIVIEGYSLGTGVAVRLAAQHPARALVLEAPFTSAEDVANDKLPFLPVHQLFEDRFRSSDWIAKVHMPLLVIHGDADTTIPQHFGRALFALANPPKQFISVPGAGHDYPPSAAQYPQIWTFLALGDGA